MATANPEIDVTIAPVKLERIVFKEKPFILFLNNEIFNKVKDLRQNLVECRRRVENPVHSAVTNKVYVTWHQGEPWRVRVKEDRKGQLRKLDYLDTSGCPNLTPRIQLYHLEDDRLERDPPPAMTKMFLYGLSACKFDHEEFRKLFNSILRTEATAIYTQIIGRMDYIIPVYTGDIIFTTESDEPISLRDATLNRWLAVETLDNDLTNLRLAQEKFKILSQRGSLKAINNISELNQNNESGIEKDYRNIRDFLEGNNHNKVVIKEHFELLGIKAGGSFGTVLDARNTESGDRVAIKIFMDTDRNDHGEEAKIGRLMTHPNTLLVLDTGLFNEKVIYLILPMMSGNLKQLIGNRKYKDNENRIKQQMKMLLNGLKFIHSLHVVHRDIKPENILVNENISELKIADFGLSVFNNNEKLFEIIGTPDYRSPEMLIEAGYSFSTDIWSLGCVFAEMILRKNYIDPTPPDDQIKTIFTMYGTPTNQDWIVNWKGYVGTAIKKPTTTKFDANPNQKSIILKMHTLNPDKRSTIDDLLQLEYFN